MKRWFDSATPDSFSMDSQCKTTILGLCELIDAIVVCEIVYIRDFFTF